MNQTRDGGATIDQTSYARAIEPIPMTSHRRKRENENLTYAEHKQVIAKRGELGWLSKQTTATLMAP